LEVEDCARNAVPDLCGTTLMGCLMRRNASITS
jgi:hypothetical protein